jgi:hypothetical protein
MRDPNDEHEILTVGPTMIVFCTCSQNKDEHTAPAAMLQSPYLIIPERHCVIVCPDVPQVPEMTHTK